MKGGLALKLSDSRYAKLLNAFKQTFIAIPSQKRGICLTDAASVILWYTDGLRSLMWEHFIHGKDIQTDCDVNFIRLTNDEILDCWIKTTGLRIANILSTYSVIGLRRQASFTARDSGVNLPEGTDPTTAIGELCSMMYHTMYYNLKAPPQPESVSQRERNKILTKTEFGAKTFFLPTIIINKVLKLLGVSDDYGYSSDVYKIPLGAQIIALELEGSKTDTDDVLHTAALCRVHGHWHYMDNNIGYSLPIKPEFDNDDIINMGLYLRSVDRPETNKFYSCLVSGSRDKRDDDETIKRAPIVSKTGSESYDKIDEIHYSIMKIRIRRCIYKLTPLTSIEPVTLETSDPLYDELMRIETGQRGNTVTSQGQRGITVRSQGQRGITVRSQGQGGNTVTSQGQGGNTVTSQGQGGNTSSSTTTSVPTSVNNTDAILNMFRSIKIKGTGGRKRKTLRNKKNKYKKTRKSRQVEE